MRKTFFGLLLALCLVVGLLPVAAMAADGTATIKYGFNQYKLTGYDTPIYTVNYSYETKDTAGNDFTAWSQTTKGASADNWNSKIEWKSGDEGPTITLKGFKMDDYNNEKGKMAATKDSDGNYTTDGVQIYAITTPKNMPTTIVITGEDSLIDTKFGITYYGNLTIKSEGDAKLTITAQSSGISSNNTAGANLNINANLDVSIRSYYGSALGQAMIQTHKANMTIDGGNITVNTDANGSIGGLYAKDSGDIIINGGNLNITGAIGTGGNNGTIKAAGGKVVINGGETKITPKHDLGIYALKGIEINNGKVDILSPYYGMNAGSADNPADIAINGGTVIVTAQNAYFKAPKLGPNVTAFAGASEESAEVYDGSDTKLSQKPWMIISSEKINIATTEAPTQPVVIVTIPTQAPTQPTAAPTQPTQAGTQNTAANNTTDGDAGSNTTVLLIAIAAIVVIAGAVVVVIIIKRKKA